MRLPVLPAALLIAAAAAAVIVIVHYAAPAATPVADPGRPPVHFRTLPPGAKLPSGAQCARWVRESPSAENRVVNLAFNGSTGQHVGRRFFPAGDSPQVKKLAPLITGDFTGTTREILRWAACKWGISQDVVFAQAAVESWWQQNQLGDWGTDPRRCPPGHGIGADGRPGQCPQSYGILQNKYSFEKAAWPGFAASTAMNADAAYAVWRSCYDGYEVWLNDEPRGQRYHAGNLWGCVGRWFAGAWFTSAADRYIRQVKAFFRSRIWMGASFGRTG